MRIFLGVLMVIVVSGDSEVTINGTLEDSVLLPCDCKENETFKWQMEKPYKALVCLYNRSASVFFDRYSDRAKIHGAENSSDCSLLLTNIRADDQGQYTCSFFAKKLYTFRLINLNIFAKYNVCHDPPSANGNETIFSCHGKGRYQKAEIQWYLDGELLTDSSKINITHIKTEADSNGIYIFESKLRITELKWTSEPQCRVNAKGISTNNSYTCERLTDPEKFKGEAQPYVVRWFKIIPIVLVLGISLILWQCSKLSQ